MKSSLPAMFLGALFLTGCSLLGHFGYYKHEKAQWATPEEAAAVKFPNSLEGSVRLTGPMMAALKVAMDDFRPPWTSPEKETTPEGRCLARWDTIDARVLQVNENLFYVELSPDLSTCAPGFIVLDAGAVYAIDGKGRILARE
jgi:hypothetical protein